MTINDLTSNELEIIKILYTKGPRAIGQHINGTCKWYIILVGEEKGNYKGRVYYEVPEEIIFSLAKKKLITYVHHIWCLHVWRNEAFFKELRVQIALGAI